MARRVVNVAGYMLPGGVDPASVQIFVTLVDMDGERVDGYRISDQKGVVGTLQIGVSDEPTSFSLTPNAEIYPETSWNIKIVSCGKLLREATIKVGTGCDISLPQLLALGNTSGYWDILDNRYLPSPEAAADGQIAEVINGVWQLKDPPTICYEFRESPIDRSIIQARLGIDYEDCTGEEPYTDPCGKVHDENPYACGWQDAIKLTWVEEVTTLATSYGTAYSMYVADMLSIEARTVGAIAANTAGLAAAAKKIIEEHPAA